MGWIYGLNEGDEIFLQNFCVKPDLKRAICMTKKETGCYNQMNFTEDRA
jgi:hypothetical protein